MSVVCSTKRKARALTLLYTLFMLTPTTCTTAPVEAAQTARLVFDKDNIRIATGPDSMPLRVEIAATQQQRMRGLMERAHLARNAGMLFLFSRPQPPTSGFWMFRTRIPLDIAFLNKTGRILAIESMAPCKHSKPRYCPSYLPHVAYSAALEVNQGFFKRHEISLGDRVILPEVD
jgi:uncharacterized membrane protein (UPF0127 family)